MHSHDVHLENRKSGLWISVDGTEGVGKTVLAKHIRSVLDKSILAPEFSDSPIGRFLQEAVQTNPHIISESLLEQSLLFLSDFFRVYDSVVRPSIANGRVVISDRGYVSKYVYQYIVLSSAYDSTDIRTLLGTLFSLIPPPDLTLLLTCDENVQIQRLLERDGHCDGDRIAFIRQANQEYLSYLTSRGCRFVQIEQSIRTSESTLLNKGEDVVGSFLRKASEKKPWSY